MPDINPIATIVLIIVLMATVETPITAEVLGDSHLLPILRMRNPAKGKKGMVHSKFCMPNSVLFYLLRLHPLF